MLVVLEDGGFTSCGLNFDARVRRESTDPEDLFMAHIGGMDSFARGLLIAHEILEKSSLADYRRERYSSFDSGPGQAFAEGRLSLEDLREHASNHGEPRMKSGRQEWVENIMNDFIFRVKH
jgi:xylose isomerase